MAYLSQLLSRLPSNIDVRMSTMGHVVWVSWHDKLAPAVGQTLLNYGGMLVGEEEEQALWFFFTDDVFLALARLTVWGNFNELPVSIELFPGRLQFDRKQDACLLLDAALQAQEMLVRDSLELWVHPKSREGKKSLPGAIYILDEPTTGLHFEDVRKLLQVLQSLADKGNTVIVIEHNLDIIKSADWIIDMGPEGGAGGGMVIAEGTPEDVSKVEESFTGQFLKPLLQV